MVDCRTPGCAGERSILIRDLAGVYGRQKTLAEALRRMRCTGCQGRVAAAWMTHGPDKVGRARAAMVALIGADGLE